MPGVLTAKLDFPIHNSKEIEAVAMATENNQGQLAVFAPQKAKFQSCDDNTCL